MKQLLIYGIMMIFVMLGCRDPKVMQKIDGNLKAELKRLHQSDRLEERISVLFRVNEDITDLHRDVLKQKGVKISAHIGDLYTATVPASQVYDVAKFRFVDYVQGQKKFKTQLSDSTTFSP